MTSLDLIASILRDLINGSYSSVNVSLLINFEGNREHDACRTCRVPCLPCLPCLSCMPCIWAVRLDC